MRVTAEKFGCSRQAVHKHQRRLIAEGAVTESGQTRNKRHLLAPLVRWSRQYELAAGLAEDAVWRADVGPLLGKLPENVSSIWHYGFTKTVVPVKLMRYGDDNLVSRSQPAIPLSDRSSASCRFLVRHFPAGKHQHAGMALEGSCQDLGALDAESDASVLDGGNGGLRNTGSVSQTGAVAAAGTARYTRRGYN